PREVLFDVRCQWHGPSPHELLTDTPGSFNGLFPSDREHGAPRGRDDPAGDAPDEELRETRAPVRPDHHEVGALGLRRANDLLCASPSSNRPRARTPAAFAFLSRRSSCPFAQARVEAASSSYILGDM